MRRTLAVIATVSAMSCAAAGSGATNELLEHAKRHVAASLRICDAKHPPVFVLTLSPAPNAKLKP